MATFDMAYQRIVVPLGLDIVVYLFIGEQVAFVIKDVPLVGADNAREYVLDVFVGIVLECGSLLDEFTDRDWGERSRSIVPSRAVNPRDGWSKRIGAYTYPKTYMTVYKG